MVGGTAGCLNQYGTIIMGYTSSIYPENPNFNEIVHPEAYFKVC